MFFSEFQFSVENIDFTKIFNFFSGMFPNYKPKVEAAKIQSSTNRSIFHIPKLPNLKKPTFKSTTDSKERENSKIRVSRYEIIAIGLLSIHALIEGIQIN